MNIMVSWFLNMVMSKKVLSWKHALDKREKITFKDILWSKCLKMDRILYFMINLMKIIVYGKSPVKVKKWKLNLQNNKKKLG